MQAIADRTRSQPEDPGDLHVRSYGSDASGRVTARPARQFVWDSLGRLTTVKDGAGATLVTYGYDPLDRLRTLTTGGTTLRYRYAGRSTSIAQVYDETAAEIDRDFANDLTERPVGSFGTTGASPASWIVNAHHDIVGSTSSTGTVGRWYRYDPWGTLVASGGSGFTPIHRYQGSFQDLTAGLVWMVHRWYDPTTGRFLSEDSLLGEPVNPDSRHRYAYGAGDPVNTWDPDGRWLESLWDIASAIMSAADVIHNPTDPGTWLLFGADVVAVIAPFVPAPGTGLRTLRLTDRLADGSTMTVVTKVAQVNRRTGRAMATQSLRHDSLGRLTDMGADLTRVDLGAGTRATAAAKAWARRYGNFEACHVLAKVLGGPGGRAAGNIVPCTSAANKLMEGVELQVRSRLRAGRNVKVDVQLVYKRRNKTPVPDEIVYNWRVLDAGPTRTQSVRIRNDR